MGYRSTVAVIMKKEDYEDFQIAYAKAFPDESSVWDEVNEVGGGSYIFMKADDIKWYGGFEDVDFVNDYLQKMDDAGNYYEYLEIGEDWDDIQYRYNVPEDEDFKLGCHRTVEVCC